MKKLSDLIFELRNKLGFSRAVFAKHIGSSITQIRRIELGTVIPDEKFIQKICDVYHVNPAYFSGNVDIDKAVSIFDSEEEMKQVGRRVKQSRIENNRTQKELSILVNLSDSYLCMIEKGESKLTEKRAVDIAEILHVGVDWLLHGDETKKEDPVNHHMIEWLWKHPEIRKEIWNQIHQETE